MEEYAELLNICPLYSSVYPGLKYYTQRKCRS